MDIESILGTILQIVQMAEQFFEALPTMVVFKANNIFCRHCGAKMDKEINYD